MPAPSIPHGWCTRAQSAVADAEALRRSRLKREAVEIADAEEVKKGLEGRTLVITATAGEDGTLYGSVGKRDVAEAVVSTTGVQVDHKKIVLDRALKEVGQHEVGVKLHREVIATVIVDIVDIVDIVVVVAIVTVIIDVAVATLVSVAIVDVVVVIVLVIVSRLLKKPCAFRRRHGRR